MYLTVCIWRQYHQSSSSSVCRQGLCSPVQIRYIKLWSHFLCYDILVQRHNQSKNDYCFWPCTLLVMLVLTGWSWSKSGSNFVTRWWHLSKSAILFGNQWTNRDKKQKVKFSSVTFVINLAKILNMFQIYFTKAVKKKKLHLTSLVVLTSSAFLLMELMRVLTSERCTSQRTKYSRPSRLSLSFRHGRVSKWWILDSNVWKMNVLNHI